MSVTTRIPEDQLDDYFSAFTRKFLLDDSAEAVDVEVLTPVHGQLDLAEGARLMGIAYERKTRRFEFELDSGDHRVVDPHEVWVVEEPDGFISALEVVYDDGSRDVVTIRRLGPRR